MAGANTMASANTMADYKNNAKKYDRIIIQKNCKNLDNDDCAICLDSLSQKMIFCLPCKHSFHYSCLNQAFEKKMYICPLCRYDLIPALMKTDFEFPYTRDPYTRDPYTRDPYSDYLYIDYLYSNYLYSRDPYISDTYVRVNDTNIYTRIHNTFAYNDDIYTSYIEADYIEADYIEADYIEANYLHGDDSFIPDTVGDSEEEILPIRNWYSVLINILNNDVPPNANAVPDADA